MKVFTGFPYETLALRPVARVRKQRSAITLHQLRIFSAVARHLHVSRAAEELHISQPSVSHQLKLLEGQLGLKLYNKISRGIELTEDGEAFLRATEPILFRVAKLGERFKYGLSTRGPVLSIGGSHSPSFAFLPKLLKVYRRRYPGVRIALRTDTSLAIEQMVQKSETEVAIITNPSPSPALVYEACGQQDLLGVAAADNPMVKKKELTAAELARIPIIVKRRKNAEVSRTESVLKSLEKRGLRLNIVLRCESAEGVKAAVKAGIGLGIMFGDMVEPELKSGELKLVKIPDLKIPFESFVIYRKQNSLSVPARDFLALLRESSKKTSAQDVREFRKHGHDHPSVSRGLQKRWERI